MIVKSLEITLRELKIITWKKKPHYKGYKIRLKHYINKSQRDEFCALMAEKKVYFKDGIKGYRKQPKIDIEAPIIPRRERKLAKRDLRINGTISGIIGGNSDCVTGIKNDGLF